MRLEEYLNTVTEQIRCTKAREMVSGELRDHVLDQAQAYEAEGMFEEEALEKAIRDMGDPVETGVSLDRIHRPKMSVGVLAAVGLISLLSIALHMILAVYAGKADVAGYGYDRSHILYTLLGYGVMLLVYRLDYSVLFRYAKQAAGAFLILVVLGFHFAGVWINGAQMYIRLGPFFAFMPVVMLLYVPLYGGVLYTYRGEGYKGLCKLLLWALIPAWITFHIPAFSQGVVLWTALVSLTAIAVYREWYRVRRTAALTALGVLLAGPPLLLVVAGALGRLASYQMSRIQAFLTNNPDQNYLAVQMKGILSGSRLLGTNAENMARIVELPGFNNDYIFVSLISAYGLIAGILAAAGLLFLVVKIFRISFRQRNELGMILGSGCGIVFLLQMCISIGMNLGLLPTTAALLPFFSSGGSGIVVSYMMLGLVLSIYRYKNILPDRAPQKAVRSIS